MMYLIIVMVMNIDNFCFVGMNCDLLELMSKLFD